MAGLKRALWLTTNTAFAVERAKTCFLAVSNRPEIVFLLIPATEIAHPAGWMADFGLSEAGGKAVRKLISTSEPPFPKPEMWGG